MGLTKRDLGLVLWLRGKHIEGTWTLPQLKEQVGDITLQEEAYLKYIRDFITWNEGYREYYQTYGKTELVNLFKYKTGSNFPLPLGFLSNTNYIPEVLGFTLPIRE